MKAFRMGQGRFLVADEVWARWCAWEDALWAERLRRMPPEQLSALGIAHWSGLA